MVCSPIHVPPEQDYHLPVLQSFHLEQIIPRLGIDLRHLINLGAAKSNRPIDLLGFPTLSCPY